MRAAPEVSCAMVEECAHEHTGAAENTRHPLRNGFTAYGVLSPEIGSFASVVREQTASHDIDASTEASGPHAFAVRFHAVRFRHDRVHRIPAPRSMTIMIRPSWLGRDTGIYDANP